MTMLATRTDTRLPAVADERLARADLRAQIARLEERLAAFAPVRGVPRSGPRFLAIADLERVRDDLVARVDAARAAERARADREAAARRRLDAMLADPRALRGHTITLADLGLPGCGTYRPKPRLGLIGRLAGWWHITLSSGCPLATGTVPPT